MISWVLGLALFAGLCLKAEAQYPPNTQVQRYSDGRVVVSTSPGPSATRIRTAPEVTYGGVTYRRHYAVEERGAQPAPVLGGTPLYTPDPPQAYSAARLDYLRAINGTKSSMKICVHEIVGGVEVTKCSVY